MRLGRAFLVIFALTACRDEGYSVGEARYDPSLLTSSGGDVSLSDGTHLDFVITSDRYRQWDAARKAFSRAVSARFGVLLKPEAPTERTIERAISYLQNQSSTRQAIERTGMSVRDFVFMTVALEQQMRLASQRGMRTDPAEFSIDTARVDSGYAPLPSPADPGLAYPYTPLPVDSPRRVDTVFLPVPRDTVPTSRDTLRPKIDPWRDSLRPPASDSTPRPARDTTRPPPDTLAPPDTIHGA